MGILDNKVAIVTGAGQGIGKGVARALAKEGAAIAVLDLDGENAGSDSQRDSAIGSEIAWSCLRYS